MHRTVYAYTHDQWARSSHEVPVAERAEHSGGAAIWLTGLSCAGKTTLGSSICRLLRSRGRRVELLDGDDMRRLLSKDLGFTPCERRENIRRIGFVAELLARNGVIAVVSAISPYRGLRNEIRCRIGNFIEVYVNAPIEICESRDVKGLYRKARAGNLRSFTGIDDIYEPPVRPEVECRTDRETVEESTAKVVDFFESIRLG